jgi:hypothetical protein
MPINRTLARTKARPWNLAQVHAGYVGDFGGKRKLSHDENSFVFD